MADPTLTPDQMTKKAALIQAQAAYQDSVKNCPGCSQAPFAPNHDPDCGPCDLTYAVLAEAQNNWNAVKPR